MRLKSGQPKGGGDDTRRALLGAAAEVFARRGFQRATVREICRRAGANVAAVNYHFGGKAELYSEALIPHRPGAAPEPWRPPAPPDAPPEARLEAFVRSFFERLVGGGANACQHTLLAREMVAPTAALDSVVDRYIRPQAEWLGRVLRDLMGPSATQERVSFASMSVVGQILFYKNCEAVIGRLDPALLPAKDTLERHVRHITEFTLAAVRPRPREVQRAALSS